MRLIVSPLLLIVACSYRPVGYDPSMLGMDAGAPPPVGSPSSCGAACDSDLSDGCCPTGCTAASDIDCNPQCGNGVLEAAEQCDPRGNCPAACPNRGCTAFAMEGSADTCSAICLESGKVTACNSDDGCCPSGCTANEDRDCLTICDNKILEASETCDPLTTCPTGCPAQGCQLRKLINPGTCAAQCVNDRLQTMCAPGDGCCPPGCNARDDLDCAAVCGNEVKESGETCDPLSSCPGSCPAQQCQLRKLVNAGSCQARCEDDRKQEACLSGDDCCPPGCNSKNDGDCAAVCGNGVKEMGETCDPPSTCATACPMVGCQLRELTNPGTCRASCLPAGSQTACVSADGCCPPACHANNDSDCSPRCNNGVIEKGEACEPVAECTKRQMACKSDQGTIRTGKGDPAACTYECVATPRSCGPADGVCPAGCSPADPDCPRPAPMPPGGANGTCTHIEWCRKPNQPNLNMLICITNDNGACTEAQRIAECAQDARVVCGTGHARPIVYKPPIGGRATE